MMATVLFLLGGMLGMCILFLTTEFRVIQRNGDSWQWCRRIYKRFNLRRIRW